MSKPIILYSDQIGQLFGRNRHSTVIEHGQLNLMNSLYMYMNGGNAYLFER